MKSIQKFNNIHGKDISVVITSWNAKSFLLQCLQSIVEGEIKHSVEVIVVDNGSTDGSCEAVKEKFRDVVLIEKSENHGFAKANNIGMLSSKGRYICLVNSDIKVLNGCLDRMVNYMDENPQVGILGPKVLWGDMTLQSSCRMVPTLWNNFCPAVGLNRIFRRSKLFSGEHMLHFQHDRIERVDVLVGCFMMVRREAIERVGLLDERFFIYGEDIDWCKRFWDAGWEVVFFPFAEVIHYGRGSSSNAPLKFVLEQEKTVIQYWKKHHGFGKQQAFKAIRLCHHLLRVLAGSLALFAGRKKRGYLKSAIEKNLKSIRILMG